MIGPRGLVFGLFIITVFSLWGMLTPPTAAALSCADFVSQAAAQSFMRQYPNDSAGLDADRNGIACESNSCPCDHTPVIYAPTPIPSPTVLASPTPTTVPGVPTVPVPVPPPYFFPGPSYGPPPYY